MYLLSLDQLANTTRNLLHICNFTIMYLFTLFMVLLVFATVSVRKSASEKELLFVRSWVRKMTVFIRVPKKMYQNLSCPTNLSTAQNCPAHCVLAETSGVLRGFILESVLYFLFAKYKIQTEFLRMTSKKSLFKSYLKMIEWPLSCYSVSKSRHCSRVTPETTRRHLSSQRD
jgi:hypothetical protein